MKHKILVSCRVLWQIGHDINVRADRPRTRSSSVHVPSHISIASKAGKCRTTSVQRIPTKGKGAGKGKKATKKSNKAVVVGAQTQKI